MSLLQFSHHRQFATNMQYTALKIELYYYDYDFNYVAW